LLDATAPTAAKATEKFGGVSTFDTNGNYITKTTNGSTVEWKDTLGRIVLRVVTYSDRREYFVRDTAGTEQKYVERLQTMTVSSAFSCSGVQDYNNVSATVVDKIELPVVDGITPIYDFSYDSKGRISQVTLPTGGTYQYTYGAVECTDGSVKALTRTITPGGTWNYDRVLVGSIWKTTVKAPALPYDGTTRHETVLEFTGGLETKRQVYTGPAVGGTLLVTVNSAYNTIGSTSVPGSRTVVHPVSDLQSKVTFLYDSFVENGATRTRGNLKEVKEHDYGTGAPAATHTRKTTFAYWHEANSAYATKNIVDRVSNIRVDDAAGTKKAETIIEYDQGTRETTSGVPQHDYTGFPASFATRGNPTTIKRWIEGATYATTTVTYDDLGNVLNTTDPGGHQSTVSYADSWNGSIAGCTPPSETLAFPTQVTNALGHRTQLTYHQCTGQLQAAKDENDIVASRNGTTFAYADPLRRMTQTNLADGGQVTVQYQDSLKKVIRTQNRTASESVVITDLFNDLGALIQRQLPGGRFVDITYDTQGGSWKVSNPHFTSPGPTDGTLETRVDTLGRTKAVVRQDGSSTALISYSSNAVLTTDESGKKRLREMDGLGRVKKVCEVTAGNARSAAETCNITGFSENGYPTTMSYDVLDNVLTTTQGPSQGPSGQQQTRTMTYDGLGRITEHVPPLVEI
jgi:YD repeat-containing protein